MNCLNTNYEILFDHLFRKKANFQWMKTFLVRQSESEYKRTLNFSIVMKLRYNLVQYR